MNVVKTVFQIVLVLSFFFQKSFDYFSCSIHFYDLKGKQITLSWFSSQKWIFLNFFPAE